MSEMLTSFSGFLKDYAALIGIPIAALVGAVAYQWQKSADRKSTLIELRRQSYITYLDVLVQFIGHPNSENRLAISRKFMELSVVASDKVVQKAGELQAFAASNPKEPDSPQKVQSLISELVLSMRQDCFGKSNITADEISKTVPIGAAK